MLYKNSFHLGLQFLFSLHTENSHKHLKKNPQLVQKEETMFKAFIPSTNITKVTKCQILGKYIISYFAF